MNKIKLFFLITFCSIICACSSGQIATNADATDETGKDNITYADSSNEDKVKEESTADSANSDKVQEETTADSSNNDKVKEESKVESEKSAKEVDGSSTASQSNPLLADVKNDVTQADNSQTGFEPFYVYTDFKSNLNKYQPSGWMGDVKGLKCEQDCSDNTYSGNYCIKITYTPTANNQWAGIYWQNPANNWGEKDGGHNLVGATSLTFYARSNQGNEVISEAKIGGIAGTFADSDVAWIKNIRLSRKWKKYTIDLSKSDLSYISGGFCIVFSRKDNPNGCTVYLDEIRYE